MICISFSRLWNCNLLCVICIQADRLCCFLLNEKGWAFQVSSIVFASYTFPQSNLLVFSKKVYWSEDKQTRNLVSFDPANFEMSKISREFSVFMPFGTYFGSHFTEKRAKSLEIFFSSENAAWSNSLKYQGIDVQIQTFTDENWNILHQYMVTLLTGTNCRFVNYKYWKSVHYTFILVQLWAILCEWPKKLMIFDIENNHWITL